MEFFKFLILFFIFSRSFNLYSQKPSVFDNIFESKNYIIVLNLSNSYSKYKTKFEKYIENPKREQIKKSEITEIENLINNTNSKLDEIYSSLSRNDVKSQIYQIKFELDELSKLLEESKKKISKKEEFKKLSYKIEYYLYRMDVYLKGLSQNLSLL